MTEADGKGFHLEECLGDLIAGRPEAQEGSPDLRAYHQARSRRGILKGSETRLRVCHVITGLGGGGAETMLCRLLGAMDGTRLDHVVVSLMDRDVMVEQIESLGVPVHCMGMKTGLPSWSASFHFLSATLRLVRIIRQLKPDVLQGWMYDANLAAQLAKTFVGRPVVVLWNIRTSLPFFGGDRFLRRATIWLGARLSRLPARIVSNSWRGAAVHQAVGYRADRTVVIPNGLDLALFRPCREARQSVREELGLPGDAVLIGLIGRYHPDKDHANFLQAAALLLVDHPESRFLLAGIGADDGNLALTQQIRELGLESRVYRLGLRRDMPRVTAALDIACSSSSQEGFSNVILEAMACSVPCVVTDVGDSRMIVGNTGIVVPPRNPQNLARGLQEFLELGPEGRSKLGLRARRRVEENFDLAAVAQVYQDLYEEVFSHARNHGVR